MSSAAGALLAAAANATATALGASADLLPEDYAPCTEAQFGALTQASRGGELGARQRHPAPVFLRLQSRGEGRGLGWVGTPKPPTKPPKHPNPHL
jgi:hypothetical protein